MLRVAEAKGCKSLEGISTFHHAAEAKGIKSLEGSYCAEAKGFKSLEGSMREAVGSCAGMAVMQACALRSP